MKHQQQNVSDTRSNCLVWLLYSWWRTLCLKCSIVGVWWTTLNTSSIIWTFCDDKNCVHGIPFFLGPLHTTASSRLPRRKPIDMTASFWLGSEYTGTHLNKAQKYYYSFCHTLCHWFVRVLFGCHALWQCRPCLPYHSAKSPSHPPLCNRSIITVISRDIYHSYVVKSSLHIQ